MARDFVQATNVELGIRADHLISFAVHPELNMYSPQQTEVFYDRLDQRLRDAIPGVSLVFEMTARDPMVLAAVAALRATRVDPIQALRCA